LDSSLNVCTQHTVNSWLKQRKKQSPWLRFTWLISKSGPSLCFLLEARIIRICSTVSCLSVAVEYKRQQIRVESFFLAATLPFAQTYSAVTPSPARPPATLQEAQCYNTFLVRKAATESDKRGWDLSSTQSLLMYTLLAVFIAVSGKHRNLP